jgi:hypothetical protein
MVSPPYLYLTLPFFIGRIKQQFYSLKRLVHGSLYFRRYTDVKQAPLTTRMAIMTIYIVLIKNFTATRCWWLTPVILATQEAEIRRISFQSQPGQIVL